MPADPERRPLLSSRVSDDGNDGQNHDRNGGYTTIDEVSRNESEDQDPKIDGEDHRNNDDFEWQSEARLVIRHSIPLIGTYLLQYFYSLVIVLVASRLSTKELAGVSLGITTSNILGYAVFEGMATALDTLCSQAYGSGRPQLVGLWCVRFTLYIHLVAVPIVALWYFSPQVLQRIVPDPGLAESAGIYLRWSIVSVPGYASFEVGKRFLQAQNDFTAGLFVLLACLPLSIFFNWLLVFHLEMRITGAALAASLTHLVRPLLLAAYVLCVNRSVLQCWPQGLRWRSREIWTGWGRMVRLSIPGALMTLSEWFSFEVLTFATSYVSIADLAAQTFLGTSTVLLWHIPFSISIACNTRIGQLIGAGLVARARRLMMVYFWIFLATAILNAGLIVGINELMVKFLIDDREVMVAVASALVWVAYFCFFDATSSWVHGIIRGLGWQGIGGAISLCVNYGFGVPLSLWLLLGNLNVGVSGIYIGLGASLAVITVVEAWVIRARSWERAVHDAERSDRSIER